MIFVPFGAFIVVLFHKEARANLHKITKEFLKKGAGLRPLLRVFSLVPHFTASFCTSASSGVTFTVRQVW